MKIVELFFLFSSCFFELPFIRRVIKANRKQPTRHRVWGKKVTSLHRKIIIRHHLKKQICAPTSSTNYKFFFNLLTVFSLSLRTCHWKHFLFGWWHDAMLNKRKRTTNGNYEPHIWFVLCEELLLVKQMRFLCFRFETFEFYLQKLMLVRGWWMIWFEP